MSTIFYAWQSDTKTSNNKHFIKKALEEAIAKLSENLLVEESPRLDHDTKNVSGHPNILQTILKKIEDSVIFVADLSFVGKTPQKNNQVKMLPNPNVLYELGYAVGKKGHETLILVMNTFYGKPDGLFFDIQQHRRPITYKLSENSSEKRQEEQLEKLSSKLYSALKNIYDYSILAAADTTEREQDFIEEVNTRITSFSSRFPDFLNSELKNPRLHFVMMPIVSTQKFDLNSIESDFRMLGPLSANGWNHKYTGYSYQNLHERFNPPNEPDIRTLVDIDENLVIHSVCLPPLDGKVDEVLLDLDSIQFWIHRFYNSFVEKLNMAEMKCPRSYFATLRITNLSKVGLYRGYSRTFTYHSRVVRHSEINCGVVTISVPITDKSDCESGPKELRPLFDKLWQYFNRPRSPFNH